MNPSTQETGPAPRRRVLFLAYYFPPLALSGVQRAAKLVKYLPENGWDVTVLTPEPGAYFAFDETLLRELDRPGIEIVRTSTLDPTRGGKRVVSLPSESMRKQWSRVSQFFLQPDNKVGWLPFAVSEGTRLSRHRSFDAIVSSAPPYSSHLAAARLSKRLGLPLILDFRDDWVGNPRHHYATSLHRSLSARMERRVIDAAADVWVINETIRTSLAERTGAQHRIHIVPQGYDPEDFMFEKMHPDPGFRIVYSGVFYDAQRPDTFLEGLAMAVDRRPDMRTSVQARFVGLVPSSMPRLVEKLHLTNIVHETGYVSHRDACRELLQADLLWMTVGRATGAEGISTGKLFEYAASGKPILGLVPEGEARSFLQNHGASFITEPDDPEAVADQLERGFDLWKEGGFPVPDAGFVARFNRKQLAADIAARLDSLLQA